MITTLLIEARALQETITQYRRHLHENAEVHDDLPVTTAFVKSHLEEMGYQPEEICKSGIVALRARALTFRGTATIEYEHTTPSLIVDQKLRNQFCNYSNALFSNSVVLDIEEALGVPKLTGSEDFAHVCEKVPGLMVIIGSGSTEEDYTFPMHHPKATFNEEALSTGAVLYANTAIEWLKHNKLAD